VAYVLLKGDQERKIKHVMAYDADGVVVLLTVTALPVGGALVGGLSPS